MKYFFVLILLLIFFYFCYQNNITELLFPTNEKIEENFIEYNTKNKEYIDVKQNNKQFVNAEYNIDPHIRHILPQTVKNLILKEYSSMSENEIEDLKDIFKSCFNDGEDFDFSKDSLILGYYINNKLVGYTGLLTSANFINWLAHNNIWDYQPYGVIDQDGLYMYNLCVLPNYRNQGIGNELIKGVIDFANEIRATHINLTVLCDKEVPIKLYKKYKFEEFYSSMTPNSGKNVITMVKYIN